MTENNLEKIMISNEGKCVDTKGNERKIEHPVGGPRVLFRDTTEVSPTFEFHIKKEILTEKLSANAYCAGNIKYPAAYEERLEYQLYKIK